MSRSAVGQGLGEGGHEAPEGDLEAGGIKALEHAAERVVARRTVGEADEPAQERQLGLRESGDVDAGLSTAQGGSQGDQQDLIQQDLIERMTGVAPADPAPPRRTPAHPSSTASRTSGRVNARPSRRADPQAERHMR